VTPADPQKVLIADDDPINRDVLCELLQPEYTVLLAENGAQAVERATRHVPDLILLDVMMPDMSGFEVLRRLRATPQLAHVSVIFVSGLNRPEDEAAGLKAGSSDYIAKPFNATVVLARVALHLQLVRQRRLLEHLAHVDGLTELANRRRFDDVYDLDWQRARRSGRPLSLALLDIDSFKQFNDLYGHPAGDRALRAVARVAGTHMRRPADLAARYGGEELVLLMPETDAAQALQIAQALRQAIADLMIAYAGSAVASCITASIGGASLDPSRLETSAALFEAADVQLYRAKQGGRNRVMWRNERDLR
jgi:diguanylate cyclase (GGDEF)-like protein